MNMIRHNHKLRDFCIRIVLCYFLNACLGIFPNIRQNHFPIRNLAEKMFSVFGADGDEIGSAVVIMP